MPHEIGEERNVIVTVEEILGKQMPERMWIDHFGIYAIAHV